ncbi:GxxExxY protein [uncultured Sunxiuqinia sp.]|uniref:GxxExxY protein n=1 Tax=uncultured Sunxiuqinia sp. TaxID=1573825 RepID=UPI00263875AD|nr:GxxExxY protein [uncultured Sunxiuqinia sp.]
MTENEISRIIVDSAFLIHKQLGSGLFESVYEEILALELEERGLRIERQKPLPVIWKEQKLEHGFRIDLMINRKVIIEIKSIDVLAPVHYKQLLTYLRLTNCRLGLLINFNESLIKDGIHRVVNNL